MKDGSNQNWDSYYSANRDFSLMTSQALTKVLSHVDAGLKKTCLDLGCGTGQLTRELFHRGYDCVGVDLAESAVRIAQGLTTQALHLTYMQGNLETLQSTDLPRQRFSLVTCKLVFAFIKDKERFLKFVYGLLPPGGTFVIITPVFGSQIGDKKPGICVDRAETEEQLRHCFGNVTVESLGDVECFIAER
ncbi:class I SAM-dependent methyltransferase [Streptomyces sp. CSDS2]|uniref:class I SAM-dependent methyltransferase n=1 Tax=Streptomyces sp. CSDS2 TaxID=3055051 RepID=UPI0025B01AC2|nr:class I SAM-dependent methyltransferase [Streptomyces sp. CSDS2]MDN3263312.1 class I SAM-dependent methyltransferase [Streptomyces sp. CSDS2]